jgi:hypothetical protein
VISVSIENAGSDCVIAVGMSEEGSVQEDFFTHTESGKNVSLIEETIQYIEFGYQYDGIINSIEFTPNDGSIVFDDSYALACKKYHFTS